MVQYENGVKQVKASVNAAFLVARDIAARHTQVCIPTTSLVECGLPCQSVPVCLLLSNPSQHPPATNTLPDHPPDP
jgi:hypothetical protein